MAWARTGFGDITDASIPKTVIVGFSVIVVGIQGLIAAFLVGILRIPYATTR